MVRSETEAVPASESKVEEKMAHILTHQLQLKRRKILINTN